jgi:hypothetical protein
MLKRRTLQATSFLIIFSLMFSLLTALEGFGGSVRSARAITWSVAMPNGEYVAARLAVRPSDGVAFVVGSHPQLGSAFWYIGTDGNAVAPQRFLTDTDLTVRDASFDRDGNLHLIFSKGTVQDTAYCRIAPPHGLGEFQACSAPGSLGRGNLAQMSVAVPQSAATPDVSYIATIGTDGVHVLDSTNRGSGWTHSYTLTGCSAQPLIRQDAAGNAHLVCRENAGSGNIVSYYKPIGAGNWGTAIPAGTCQVTNNACVMDLAMRSNGTAVLPHVNAGTAFIPSWNGTGWQSNPGNPFGAGLQTDNILNFSAFSQPNGFGLVWATQGSDRAWYSTSADGGAFSAAEAVWYILGNSKSAIGGATSGRVYVVGQFEDSVSNGSVYYSSGIGALDPPTPTPVPPTATSTAVPPTATTGATVTATVQTSPTASGTPAVSPTSGTPSVTVTATGTPAVTPTMAFTPTPTASLAATVTIAPTTPSPAGTATVTLPPAVTATPTPTRTVSPVPTNNATATAQANNGNLAATATVLANSGKATATALAYDATVTAGVGQVKQGTATAQAGFATVTAGAVNSGATATIQAGANSTNATAQANTNIQQATAQANRNLQQATATAAVLNATATVKAQIAAQNNRPTVNNGSNANSNNANSNTSGSNTGNSNNGGNNGNSSNASSSNAPAFTPRPTKVAAIALPDPEPEPTATAMPQSTPIDEVAIVEEPEPTLTPLAIVPADTGDKNFSMLPLPLDNLSDNASQPDTLWQRLFLSLLLSLILWLGLKLVLPHFRRNFR